MHMVSVVSSSSGIIPLTIIIIIITKLTMLVDASYLLPVCLLYFSVPKSMSSQLVLYTQKTPLSLLKAAGAQVNFGI